MNKAMPTPDQTPVVIFDPNNPPNPGGPLMLGNPAEPGTIVQADASGRITKDPAKDADTVLKPFPDGYLFRYGPSGNPDGSCFLIDATRQPVALVKNAFIADFLCRGAHLFFIHLKAMQTQPATTHNENTLPAPDTNLPADNSATTCKPE